MRNTWKHTAGGRHVDLSGNGVSGIDIKDIAYSLSRTCRFGGHTREFFSVARHSIFVCNLILEDDAGTKPSIEAYRLAYAGLLHDAHEAYIGDLSTPVKAMIGDGYRELDKSIQKRCFAAFGADFDLLERVKHYDQVSLATEFRDLMGGIQSHCGYVLPAPSRTRLAGGYDPDGDAKRFLLLYHYLSGEVNP